MTLVSPASQKLNLDTGIGKTKGCLRQKYMELVGLLIFTGLLTLLDISEIDIRIRGLITG